MADILYIKSANSSFIKLDEEILTKHFSVKTFLLNQKGFVNFLWSLTKMKIFFLINIWSCKIIFIRFCDYYAAIIAIFSKLFNKKLIIVVGGYDAVHIPEYQYGAYHNAFRGWCVKFAYKNATLILPNNPTLIENTNDYDEEIIRKEGVKYFVPNTKADFKVIYNGFKLDFWNKISNFAKDENLAITVAYIDNYKTFLLKGIDSFIEMARQIPEKKFVIIGMSVDFANKNNIEIPSNLQLIPKMNQEELIEFYQRAKVFCLFSLTEGMPNVLCEAMLCKCIPVGSRVNSIPEIIGNTGFIVENKDTTLMRSALNQAFESDLSLGGNAKKRIIENFSFERREKELVKTLKNYLIKR